MGDVRNCKRCKKIFNYMGGLPICSNCRKQDEEDFQAVKEYLYKNPGANLTQVSTDLEISVQQIRMYLKEGRLEIMGDGSNLVLECESCGKSIRSGRYCDECSKNMANGLKEASGKMSQALLNEEKDKKMSGGMKYLNKGGKK